MKRMFNAQKLIEIALDEDAAWGDVTTESCVPEEKTISGEFLAKENTVVCGLFLLQMVFEEVRRRIGVSSPVSVRLHAKDGDEIREGTVLASVYGSARAILTGERVALNLLQQLSGVAAGTRAAVKLISGTAAKICDTRKTVPGMRVLQKYAVRVGGGVNHRMGLSDGVLIKDNHIAAAGGIANAVESARERVSHTMRIEVEVTGLEGVREALAAGADIILLDNMDNDEMTEAVRMVNGRAVTEASGNMLGKDLRAVASTGVDLISIGGLTHSVRSADISLKFGAAPKAI
ncbi:MAG: carboxylating nicotinate-nucleotide diphosphorylase [Oscillospiraceae bacterium]|jgi:nicotinate-nucleotide pyrophosphorylase (carboxylating)|nr:carboxylating nicotinate-nucleotide diphosphorylase [Oscillospiraceae bacterium]